VRVTKAVIKILAGLLVMIAAFGHSLRAVLSAYNLAFFRDSHFPILGSYWFKEMLPEALFAAAMWFCGIFVLIHGFRQFRRRS
jgi:hypothetical protein